MLKLGIIGLPNVGKSTLFNALTRAHAPAENYPFTTIEPNFGTVLVPDPRLDELAGFKLLRQEGKHYEVKDGDVCRFHFA